MLQVIPRLPGDDGFNRPVRLRAQAHQLVLDGRNKEDDDWTSIPLQMVNVTGKPVTIALNRSYLLTALKFGLNTLEIEQGLSPVVFSNGGKKMVIMPVNLDPAAPAPGPTTATTTSEESTATTPTEVQTPAPETPEPTNEERNNMPRTTNRLEATSGARTENHNGNGNGTSSGNGNGNGNGSAVKSVVEHIDQIKDNLKAVIRDLNDVADSLKQAEKEKRTSEREIEGIRNKLLQIQKVTI